MKGMTVNFNNLRKQALYAYDSLAEKLDRAILKDDQYAKPNDVRHGQDINIQGYVLIDKEDIQKDIDNLRRLIGSIAMCFEPDDENFKDVYIEVYPKEDDQMFSFNDEDDE